MSQVDGGGDLRFPDAPQLRLDELLAQLIDRAQDVIAAQGRLRGLLRASQSITGDLDLPVVLRRVAEAARQLVGARYGALGVVGRAVVCRSSSSSASTPRPLRRSARFPRARVCSEP